MTPAPKLWTVAHPGSPAPASRQPPILTLVEGTCSVDADLIARALRRGAASAAAEQDLYRRHRPGIVRIVRSFSELDPDEVEDVVQEAFVRAFRALGSLKDPERFAPWLSTIARNRARSYLSSRAVHTRAAEEASREAALSGEVEAPASQRLEHEARLGAVREIIAALREGPEKETVRLFYLEGTLSAREIAQLMGVGKSAVTMRLERFRSRVRKELVSRCAG